MFPQAMGAMFGGGGGGRRTNQPVRQGLGPSMGIMQGPGQVIQGQMRGMPQEKMQMNQFAGGMNPWMQKGQGTSFAPQGPQNNMWQMAQDVMRGRGPQNYAGGTGYQTQWDGWGARNPWMGQQDGGRLLPQVQKGGMSPSQWGAMGPFMERNPYIMY